MVEKCNGKHVLRSAQRHYHDIWCIQDQKHADTLNRALCMQYTNFRQGAAGDACAMRLLSGNILTKEEPHHNSNILFIHLKF